MESRQKKRLGDMLIEEQIITDEQLSDALEKKKGTTKRLGEVLVELGYTSETDIAKALSSQLGLEIVSLSGIQIEENVLKLVDVAVLRKYVMVPIGFSPNNMNEVRVAMADPMDMRGIDDFSIITNLQVAPVIATTHDIMLTLDRFYGSSEARKVAEAYALERRQEEQREQEKENDEDIANSPIVLLVNAMIEQAARQRASDIHIEPQKEEVLVRMRIDGLLHKILTVPSDLQSTVISRLKIMGGMNISERKIPQDGHAMITVRDHSIDIRMSVMPTVYGEKVVLRLLDKSSHEISKHTIGLTGEDEAKYDALLSNSNGIILLVGPTGSGKSTTMCAMLSELAGEEVNVVTLEDPVEYNIAGVNQCQINEKTGMTFASGLMAVLRQDPDIIMLGEIRDEETAAMAVHAALTGHLVLSTLHTNDAIGAVYRLLDMGIADYLLAAGLRGVLAQRLLRRPCRHCGERRFATAAELQYLGRSADEKLQVVQAHGCEHCHGTGYRGRLALHELVVFDKRMQQLLVNGADEAELLQEARKQGWRSLYADAVAKVLQGATTVEELWRVGITGEADYA